MLRYAMYFRFMNDVIFAHNGTRAGMSTLLLRVTSLRRRAQANTFAVSYCLRRVLNIGAGRRERIC